MCYAKLVQQLNLLALLHITFIFYGREVLAELALVLAIHCCVLWEVCATAKFACSYITFMFYGREVPAVLALVYLQVTAVCCAKLVQQEKFACPSISFMFYGEGGSSCTGFGTSQSLLCAVGSWYSS